MKKINLQESDLSTWTSVSPPRPVWTRLNKERQLELTGSGCVRFKLYDDRRVGLIQLTLSELGLIGVVSFHCCVKLVQDFQNLLVDFKCDFSALFIHPGDILVYISAPRGDVGIVNFSNGRVVLKEFNNPRDIFISPKSNLSGLFCFLDQLPPYGRARESGPAFSL